MLFGIICFLASAIVSLEELPKEVLDVVAPAGEVSGSFRTVKEIPMNDGRCRKLETFGVYHLTPKKEIVWETKKPFATLFKSTTEKYVYTNIDERVEVPLNRLPAYEMFLPALKGDFDMFLKTFDAMYKRDGENLHLLAKPKSARLKKAIKKVELDIEKSLMTLRMTFTNEIVYSIILTLERGG
jgi:hypothetical protein